MYQAGGRITITMGGVRFSPRGKATIDAAGLENDIQENHDGTVARTTKSKAVMADLTFDRGNASNGGQRPRWDASFMTPFYDVTITETDVGVQHIFTGAAIKGTPKLDTETGEVSGLSIFTDAASYSQVNI